MLSAVETFGTATAAAHNPFAIAAAVVMPTQNHIQQSGQVSLEHYTIGHSQLLNTHSHHHHRNNFNHQILSNQVTSGGLFPIYSPSTSSTSSSPSSTSCSPPINKSKSPRLNTSDSNNTCESIIAMSSTEFVRPHPKQPRYSTSNISNNNISNSNNSNFCNNNNINNNNSIGSNGIPLQVRNNKIGNISGNINNNSANQVTKSTIGRQRKYSAEPQSGPVNLVTNNNNNNISNNNSIKNNNNNNSGCRVSSPTELLDINGNSGGIPLLQQKQHSPQSTGGSALSSINDNDVISALYSQKLPFATAPTVVSNAIAAAAYQFNYPHIYARSQYGTPALYPSHHPLNSRIQQLQNSYIGSTHPSDLTFSPYLPSSIQQYTNNNTPGTGSLNILQKPTPLSPTNLMASGGGGVVSNNNNLNNSRNVQQNFTIAQQQTTNNPLPHIINIEQSRSMLQLNHPSDKELPIIKNSIAYSGHISTSNTKPPVSTSTGFKVPSGKDGSLKHRFLTRPSIENDPKKLKSQITTTVLRSSNISNAPSNFTKGSFIELNNGVLRKVEDMRTEDFIQSAERSQHHQLADSTVVKIGISTNTVIITFCYDKNRLKADVEVSLEHPFFVYGQGWASCNPELTLQAFGLKCQRLQVGDVCISLIAREETTTTYNNQLYYKDNNDPLPPTFYPQNLSRKSQHPSTILTSSTTGVAVSSRLSVPQPPPPPSSSTLQVAAVYLPLSHHIPQYDLHSYETKSSHLQNSVIGGGGLNGSSGGLIYPKHGHSHELRKSHTISEIVNSESTKSTSTYQLKNNNKEEIHGQDLTTNNINNNSCNDEPIDVSLSRKRKCDDNEDFK